MQMNTASSDGDKEWEVTVITGGKIVKIELTAQDKRSASLRAKTRMMNCVHCDGYSTFEIEDIKEVSKCTK